MSGDREYLSTHPWLTFDYRLDFDGNAALWSLLGEAFSKCQHLAGTPLAPQVAAELSRVYFAKGALATTAIEGNTLTEEDAAAIIAGSIVLPPSRRYLQREIENVVGALNDVNATVRAGRPLAISSDWLREQNRLILDGLDVHDHVVPGEFTTARVVVGGYRGAPPRDVPYLIDRLVDWLNQLTGGDTASEELRFFQAFLAATLGHLYLAWIHPFGDGNGRTARLLECAILARSGLVPWVSSNVLSDHYNQTRNDYYLRLDRASKARDVAGFLRYAAQGFVDELRDQIRLVQQQQIRVSWVNFVHEQFASKPNTDATDRQRTLVLALPSEPVSTTALRELTPRLAGLYAVKGDKTLTRDVNAVVAMGLAIKEGHTLRSAVEIMRAFIPGR
ncbi:MAG TPA: Fic family protein [Pseudonocardiaceae bacterium]